MRTTSSRLVSPLVMILGLAACKTGTTPNPQFAPMPAGETARTNVEAFSQPAVTYVQTDCLIDQIQTTAAGQNHLRVRLAYCVDVTNELLAEQCVRANWQSACAHAEKQLATVNFQSEQFQSEHGRQHWERDLKQQFTEILFPCNSGAPLATVSSIIVRAGTN